MENFALDQTTTESIREAATGFEAWRLEVDQIIAAIQPRVGADGCANTRELAGPAPGPDGFRRHTSGLQTDRTQPCAPTPSILTTPTIETPRDPSEAATSPAHPVAVASLRAACELADVPFDRVQSPEAALIREVAQAATEVHQALGPGLREHVYQRCLDHELTLRGLRTQTDVPVAVSYKGTVIETAFVATLMVEGRLLVEIEGVEWLGALHEARLRTFLTQTGVSAALLINFHEPDLTQGLRAVVGACSDT